MKQQKTELIISKTKVILEGIESNLETPEQVEISHINHDYQEQISKFAKIDLLIIDDHTPLISSHNIKTVINLSHQKYHSNDIILKKPFKLTELLDIIKIIRSKKQIFCCLNQQLIYDEESCKLHDRSLTIRFTEKENEVFKSLLLAGSYRMSKDDLYKNIWQYHSDSNSNTIETHMSRLKLKLPAGFMQLRDNFYELMIMDIV